MHGCLGCTQLFEYSDIHLLDYIQFCEKYQPCCIFSVLLLCLLDAVLERKKIKSCVASNIFSEHFTRKSGPKSQQSLYLTHFHPKRAIHLFWKYHQQLSAFIRS